MAKAKRAVNPPDKAGHRKGRAHVPARQEDMAPVSRRNPRVCATCGSRKAVDDRDRTEHAMANSDHPLIAHLRFHDRYGENGGKPAEGDLFLAWLDHSRTLRRERRDAAIDLARSFTSDYPILGMLIAASIFGGRSNRNIADELGCDDHTVSKQLKRGRDLLQQRANAANLFYSAIDESATLVVSCG